jgi:arabinose-5-phosphate isomerase
MDLEISALEATRSSINDSYIAAIDVLLACNGKVVVTGVGKSGIIGRKIAATMSSTGTLAIFVHPTDALHGDMGVITKDDVVLAIGKSGSSEELNNLLPAIRKIGAKIVCITSDKDSPLAKSSDIVIDLPVKREACPLNLAPTSSTTATLLIGDALAMTLMELKGFAESDFAIYHPGGKLGRKLVMKVRDVAVPKARCAVLDAEQSTMKQVLTGLTTSGLGVVVFENAAGQLSGIITDGDIRRLIEKHEAMFFSLNVQDHISKSPITVPDDSLAAEALQTMESRERPLNFLLVTSNGKFSGLVRNHDLMGFR